MDWKEYTSYACKNIAFIPAVQRGERKLVKPVNAFLIPDWELLGFPILDPTLGEDVVDDVVDILGIEGHPPTSQLVNLLETSPPSTESQACNWFRVLSSHIQGLCHT